MNSVRLSVDAAPLSTVVPAKLLIHVPVMILVALHAVHALQDTVQDLRESTGIQI